MLQVTVHALAMTLHFGQKMWRIRRRDALGSEMPADIEIGGILPFLDRLMLRARLFHGVLLRAAAFVQRAIARLKFAADSSDIFFRHGKFALCGRQPFLGQTAGIGTAQSRPRQFRALVRQTRAARTDSRSLRLQICRRVRLNAPDLFQQLLIRSVNVCQASIHAFQFSVAQIGSGFEFVAALQDWFFFRFEFGQRGALFLRVFLTLRFDLLDAFLELRDADGDFFLLLLELFQRDDFVAHLGKIDCLRTTFPAEIDMALLQEAFLMAQRHACFLPAYLEAYLAKACSDETHRRRLREERGRQIEKLWRCG